MFLNFDLEYCQFGFSRKQTPRWIVTYWGKFLWKIEGVGARVEGSLCATAQVWPYEKRGGRKIERSSRLQCSSVSLCRPKGELKCRLPTEESISSRIGWALVFQLCSHWLGTAHKSKVSASISCIQRGISWWLISLGFLEGYLSCSASMATAVHSLCCVNPFVHTQGVVPP